MDVDDLTHRVNIPSTEKRIKYIRGTFMAHLRKKRGINRENTKTHKYMIQLFLVTSNCCQFLYARDC